MFYYLTRAAVDSWLVLFILALPTPLHPGLKSHVKECGPFDWEWEQTED